jgi:hypothetical protein
MQKVVSCINCGAPNSSDQQFCTTCGARLAGAEPQPAVPQHTTLANKVIPNATTAQLKPEAVSQNFQLLRIAAPVFRIVGWVVLAGGVIGSLLMTLLISQGALTQLASLLGNAARILGLSGVSAAVPLMVIAIGVTCSLLLGLGMLAFSELCNAVGDMEERSRTNH